MKTTRTVMREETVTACDVCGTTNKRIIGCCGCGIDVCRDCSRACDLEDDGIIPSDFTPYVCLRCASLVKPYQDRVRAIKDAAADQITSVEKEWVAECRAAREDKSVPATHTG